jgi:hypothetical protein
MNNTKKKKQSAPDKADEGFEALTAVVMNVAIF